MKKGNVGVILIVAIMLSFICGALGTYVVIEIVGIGNSAPVIVNSRGGVTYNEDNSIAGGVSKIYDSVVVVEGFTNGALTSTGTGFIYKKVKDNTFYIMTNHHVINGVGTVKVILSDNTEVEASVKGSEVYSDIAVLSIKTDKVKSVAILGKSSKLNVGDTVFAVGSPEGATYAGTVTKGILSGMDRLVAVGLSNSSSSDYYMKVLQTDTAINPGNSGGPLCNINGEVIGITNMKLVDSTVEGMGFAIPIEDALLYSEKLEKGQSIVRPYFGIGMLEISNSYNLWQSGIIVPDSVKSGVVVTQVADNSPASIAKIKKGDIILSLGGKSISSIAEFRYELYKHQVGEEVEVEFYRNGKVKSTKVKLTENKQ